MATTVGTHTTIRGRRRQGRTFTTTQAVLLAVVICAAFWLALGTVLWAVFG